ncbi:chorismate mutase [Pseudolactococcus hodotermopsidis]|nr:chorismate mutase [Lactococcus hodotermopsidis]
MNLDEIREDIDLLDTELVRLLEARMNLVSQVTAFKQMTGMKVLDNSRELAILETVANRIENPEFTETIVATFKDILKNSRHYQNDALGN